MLVKTSVVDKVTPTEVMENVKIHLKQNKSWQFDQGGKFVLDEFENTHVIIKRPDDGPIEG